MCCKSSGALLNRCVDVRDDHFEVRNFRQASENLVLHAFSEEGVVGIAAEILKWQHRDRFLWNCSRLGASRTGSIRRGIPPEEEQADRNHSADHDHVNPDVFLLSGHVRHRVGRCRALNSLRRQLKHPGQNKRNRQPDDNEQDKQADHPVRNIEDRKHLRDSLRKRPTGDDVGDRNLVNVAPL